MTTSATLGFTSVLLLVSAACGPIGKTDTEHTER